MGIDCGKWFGGVTKRQLEISLSQIQFSKLLSSRKIIKQLFNFWRRVAVKWRGCISSELLISTESYGATLIQHRYDEGCAFGKLHWTDDPLLD